MPDPGRILVVDDEANVRELLSVVLGRDGYEVTAAPDGAQALALFRKGQTDLVLQDLKMPGMDGLTLLKSLKEISPTIPVIMLTAFATWDSAVEAMRLGAYDYLKKPFDNDQVRYTVQRAILRLRRYREAVNAEVYVHSINLAGYAQAQTAPEAPRTQLLSGWSENIFQLVRGFEGGTAPEAPRAVLPGDDPDEAEESVTPKGSQTIPTIVQLRERFG